MHGIVANVESDRVLRTGAKVWILRCNGDAACPYVMGLSKSGRMVRKYMHFKRLTNFRGAWVPEHLRGDFDRLYVNKADAALEASCLISMWADVRYFNRDGTAVLKAGISEQAAFNRALNGA